MLHRFPGGLKERTATQVHAKDPSEILRRAVAGMLPKNTLRKVGAGVQSIYHRPETWKQPCEQVLLRKSC